IVEACGQGQMGKSFFGKLTPVAHRMGQLRDAVAMSAGIAVALVKGGGQYVDGAGSIVRRNGQAHSGGDREHGKQRRGERLWACGEGAILVAPSQTGKRQNTACLSISPDAAWSATPARH